MCQELFKKNKNKIQLRKLEDLIGFMERFMNWAAISPNKKHSEELHKTEGFYRKESGTRRTLAKKHTKQNKKQVHRRKVKVQGDNSFLSAQLQRFSLAGLVAG